MIHAVTCTKGSKSLSVLQQSVAAYANNLVTLRPYQTGHTNFGDAYNYAMTHAFKDHDEILICNDDIVLTPSTIPLLLEDVAALKAQHPLLGLVAPRSDNVRGLQSIRETDGSQVAETHTLSPILAWVSRAAFQKAQFPPINWFSDDVLCADLAAHGYRHFLSRSYVHHVGSATIGENPTKHVADAMPWLISNRPEYVRKWWPHWQG